MADRKDDGKKRFAEFLRNAPTLEDAAADDSVELTGLVSRTTDGRFAITTDAGQTYELDVDAVREFREVEAPGAASAAAIRVGRDLLTEAALRPSKPTIKDLIKDPIKDIIHDGKHMITDPIVDQKSPIKDVHKDPLTDPPKPVAKDPPFDPKHPFKDVHKDPLTDPNTFVPEGLGTGAADPIGQDPRIDPTVNPAAPFVMATPHQAPQHLLAMQVGAPAAAALTQFGQDQTQKEMVVDSVKEPISDTQKELIRDTFKEMIRDTHKEMVIDTQKELIADTHKELIRDTAKEMIWDTMIEQGPNTLQEGTFDPGQFGQFGQPGFGPGV